MGQSKKEKNKKRREARKKAVVAKTNVGIKEPQAAAVKVDTGPPGKPPKKIRMLISCANQNRSFAPGDIFQVPQEIPVETARGWINVGTAEDISDLEEQREKKTEEPLEVKVIEPEETKDEAPEEEELALSPTNAFAPETKEDPPEEEEPSGEEELPEETEEPPEPREPEEEPKEEEETKELPVDNKK